MNDNKYYGRMNDPDASAWMKGGCGEEMEFYLIIRERIVVEIRYYSEGCEITRACAEITAAKAAGKDFLQILKLSPRDIIAELPELNQQDWHCAILAVSTLHKAVADYLFQQ